MTPHMQPAAGSNTARASVNVFDGKRQPYSGSAQLLISAIDGNQHVQHRDFHHAPNLILNGLPLFDNFGDDYTFLASAKGYNDAGFFPVKLAANVLQTVDLMLLPKINQLNFANATWAAIGKSRPALQTLLAQGASSTDAAGKRYGDIQEDQDGEILACLLNITTAMQQILLPKGSPFDYLKGVVWNRDGDKKIAQDRFFAWADPALIDQIKQAQAQKPPEFVAAPFALHPGATRSYKQVEFGEANVQLTFHENDRLMIGDVNCVMVEPDIDYFKDAGAHLIFEVLVNALGSMTDPRQVYVLRWIAGLRAGIAEFDPLYTVEQA